MSPRQLMRCLRTPAKRSSSHAQPSVCPPQVAALDNELKSRSLPEDGQQSSKLGPLYRRASVNKVLSRHWLICQGQMTLVPQGFPPVDCTAAQWHDKALPLCDLSAAAAGWLHRQLWRRLATCWLT